MGDRLLSAKISAAAAPSPPPSVAGQIHRRAPEGGDGLPVGGRGLTTAVGPVTRFEMSFGLGAERNPLDGTGLWGVWNF